MKRLNRLQKSFMVIMLLLLAGVLLYFGLQDGREKVTGRTIRFSKESGFYNRSIRVELGSDRRTELYYTLDGSVPKPENEQAHLYTGEGILLEAAKEEQVCTIRAGAYMDGILLSDIESRTYIVGTNVNARFSIPVLVVSGSPEEFYNEENGIMSFGQYEGRNIADDEDLKELAGAFQQGNRYQKGRESEKEVFITLFNKAGEQLLSQNGGFRLYGAYSRMKNQPSFRLYARSEYDEVKDFDYVFFEDQYTAAGTLQSEFKRVIVRNSGDDNGYGFIRSELATRIARQSGYKDAPSASPVCVYLNGEYYGVHWFVTNFDESYFREAYGEYSGEMCVYEGTVNQLSVEDGEDEVHRQLAEQYYTEMSFLENAELTREENWQRLNALIDVENFIRYVALQYYVSNGDCLRNNFRVYRYYAPDGNYSPGTVFDGRYRLILFDLDEGLGLVPDFSYILPEEALMTTDAIAGELDYQKLFVNLLKREDCRRLYIRYTLSLMNYYYSEQYVKAELDKMHGSRNAELTHMILNTDLVKNNFEAADVTDMDFIAHQMFLIQRFAQLRPEFVREDFRLAFGEMTGYTLQLDNPQQAAVTLDYATVSEEVFTGSYYAEIPLEISVQTGPGYEFDYWLVNGEVMEQESFVVERDMLLEGQLRLTCVCRKKEDAELCISGVKAKEGDFIEITNIGESSRDLSEYCLSDNTSYRKSSLPAVLLEPGETITVYCKGYSEIEALGKPVTNFNIKAGETVSLYRVDGTLVDSVEVPQLGSGQGVWRVDFTTGEYREVLTK